MLTRRRALGLASDAALDEWGQRHVLLFLRQAPDRLQQKMRCLPRAATFRDVRDIRTISRYRGGSKAER